MSEKTIEDLKAEIFSLQKANGEVAMMWAETEAENQRLRTAVQAFLSAHGNVGDQLEELHQLTKDKPVSKLLQSPDWPYVAAYMRTMMVKLNKNLHKGSRGWLDMDMRALVRRARMELLELENAIDFEGPTAVMLESSDVGAFMMMIHDKAQFLEELEKGINESDHPRSG